MCYIILKSHLTAQYSTCFDGIGKFQGKYNITSGTSIPLVKVRQSEPAWVNSLDYWRKPNGRLRMCLDQKDLNTAIQRHHHVTPTLDGILPKLNGATQFPILVARRGKWNVMLEEESSYLTTFNSSFGRYRFKLMSFGLNMSHDGCNHMVLWEHLMTM